MAASIKDVAKEAGVSIATVSRVLNEIDVVNDETKKKVQDAIKKLGYRPNIVARSLKTQRTKTIGILIPDISSQFYPEVVRGAEDVANIYDYNVILCNSDLDEDKEKEYLRVLKEKMVDGILYMSSALKPEITELISELNLKTVLVESTDPEGTYPSVSIDNVKAAYEATNYLIKKGNKDIAFIGVKEDAGNAWAERYKGFQKAMEENGFTINKDMVYFGSLKSEVGYKGIVKILKAVDSIDAVFCASDQVAMGAINALRAHQLSVPQDVDVMGFNNIDLASVYYPNLTTVGLPIYDMGSIAMRMLIKLINNKTLEQGRYILDHEIIERDSCK